MPPRNRITTLLPLALALVLASCGGSGPADVAVKATKHLVAGEIDAVMPYLSSRVKMLGESEVRALFHAAAAEQLAEGKLSSKVKIKVVSEKVQGDVAIIVLLVTLEDGSSTEETMRLVRENGEWKITFA